MLNDYESLRKVGDNIRKERKSQGLTLLEMHLRSGVDSKNLGKIEKGTISLYALFYASPAL